jgi:hypothetical protein
MSKDLREIGRIKIDDTKEFCIGENSALIVISEYIDSPSYKGFTNKTISLDKENLELFVRETRRVLSGELEITIMSWGKDSKNELIIKKIKKKEADFKAQKYDLRQYVNSTAFNGYTKKGIRTTAPPLKNLISFLQRLQNLREGNYN